MISMECEICGRRSPDMAIVSIEGAKMTVCPKCQGHGSFVASVRPPAAIRKRTPEKSEQAPEIDVIDNYAEVIQKARIGKGLGPKDLANRISEKESVIKHVEQGKLEPTEKLARKLEKFLGVSLLQLVKRESIETRNNDAKLTLGDIVKIRKKGTS